MGINITEIGQKVLDVVQNGANVVKRLYDMHYNPTPMDVELPWIDENGQLNTYKIPNDAKKRQTYLDIIGAAIAEMNVTFYVDAQNGDDSNPGTENAPFKSLWKAINSVPSGGRGVITLLSDVYLSAEPGSSYFNDRRILIRTRDNTIVQDTTDKFLACADTYGYIKIYSGNSYSGGIEIQQTSALVRFVDTVGDCVIGDYDSDFKVTYSGTDIVQKAVEALRSQIRVYSIKTTFVGNKTANCYVITHDADYTDIKLHASCILDSVLPVYRNVVPMRAHPKLSNQSAIFSLYIDAENGSDFNMGTQEFPLKTFEEAVRRANALNCQRIEFYLMSDVEVHDYVVLINKRVRVRSIDNNVNSAYTLKIYAQDNDGDGVYRPSLTIQKSLFICATHVEFVNPNGDSGVYATCVFATEQSYIRFVTGLVDDDGNVAQAKYIVNDYATAIAVDRSFMELWDTDVQLVTDNTRIMSINWWANLNVGTGSVTINGDSWDNTTFIDHSSGIVKDSNGNPRNFISNIVV